MNTSGVDILVVYLTEIYSCFYINRNLLALLQLLSVVYQYFLRFFHARRKGSHLPPCIFVLHSLDNLSILYFTGLFYKNVSQQLVPSYDIYYLHNGNYHLHTVYCYYLSADVEFFPFFIQFQKCKIVSYFGFITFDCLNTFL